MNLTDPLAAAAARGQRVRDRRALASHAVNIGLLWSCASEAVYDDLVEGGYISRADAATVGQQVARVSGLLYEVMYLVPDREHPGTDTNVWLNHDGYTARELLDAFRTGGLVQMGNSPEPSPRLARYSTEVVPA